MIFNLLGKGGSHMSFRYLTFIAQTDNSTFKMQCRGNKDSWGDTEYPSLMVSVNGSAWTGIEWTLDPTASPSAYSATFTCS